jgi:translation initiation factor 1
MNRAHLARCGRSLRLRDRRLGWLARRRRIFRNVRRRLLRARRGMPVARLPVARVECGERERAAPRAASVAGREIAAWSTEESAHLDSTYSARQTRDPHAGCVHRMAKQKRTVPVSEADKLTHSPFAGLRAPASVAPGAPAAQPATSTLAAIEPRWRGRLVLQRETKHRGGKVAIVIRGFEAVPGFDAHALEALAKELKQLLGCGGSALDDHEILLQGDQPAKIAELLRAKGFRVAGVTR